MRKHERDGLWMLAFDETAQLRRVRLLQGFDVLVHAAPTLRQILGQSLGAFLTEGIRQHSLGRIEAASPRAA